MKTELLGFSLSFSTLYIYSGNQSVENACVAFVKGANERNEFSEKLYKHWYMTK